MGKNLHVNVTVIVDEQNPRLDIESSPELYSDLSS